MRHLPTSRWAAIKLFAMDVDGILTDGTVHVSSNGVETKQFSILDGMGLVRLRRAGIATAWISGRPSGATTARAEELDIPHDQIAYMGDDDIDAPAIQWAGVGVTVPDAMPAALDAADYLTTRPAGRGAVREVCEQILRARGQ